MELYPLHAMRVARGAMETDMKHGYLNSMGNALAALLAAVLLTLPTAAQAERLKDLASIQGVRGNQLIGYGLVVGLDGTGDQVRQAPFTQQSVTNMLSQLGVTVPNNSNMQLKNVA